MGETANANAHLDSAQHQPDRTRNNGGPRRHTRCSAWHRLRTALRWLRDPTQARGGRGSTSSCASNAEGARGGAVLSVLGSDRLSNEGGGVMKFEKLLFELPPAPPDMPDPVHNEHDLWRGIDAAERFEGLTLDDIKLVFQYRRPAAIGILSRIGAELDDRTFCKAAWLAGHRMQFDGATSFSAARRLRGRSRRARSSRRSFRPSAIWRPQRHPPGPHGLLLSCSDCTHSAGSTGAPS